MAKLIFAGTPDIAATVLAGLLTTSHEIVAVYTQPDRPAGRGRHLMPSAVKVLAQQHQLPIYQPETLKDPQTQVELANLQADLMIVVAYGLLLPLPVLNAPRLGCINLHTSLLPRWRGAAPIARSILHGDAQAGICIMQMDVGLDTGDILASRSYAMQNTENTLELTTLLAGIANDLLLETLDTILNKNIHAVPQAEQGASYAAKIQKQEGCIDWQKSAIEIDRQIRAFNPWPVAYSTLGDKTVRIWQGSVVNTVNKVAAGTIVATQKEGIDVGCGQYLLRIEKAQLPSGKVLTAQQLLQSNQHPFQINRQFQIL